MKTILKVLLVIACIGGAGYWTRVYLKEREASKPAAAPAGGGSGARSAGPGGKAPALPVETFTVTPLPIDDEVPATGSLLADESVAISSEQSRRLVEVLVEEGSEVVEGQELYRLDDSDLRARLRELEARRDLAVVTKERLAGLLDLSAVPQADVDEAESSVAVLDAQIELLKTDIEKTRLRAPFAGRLGLRQVSPGAWLTPDRVITTLLRTDRIKVDFKLPERYSAAVRTGSKFRFRALGDGEWLDGTVTVVDPVIERSTRSVVVRGEAPNPGHLMPGGFVNVRYPLDSLEGGFLIPTQAVVPSALGNAVWVVEDGKAALRSVELGTRTAESIQVLAGLAEGDQVIVTNLLRVRPGAVVAVRNADSHSTQKEE